MYDFQLIHNNILEDISKSDKCSNFILTEQQFKNALDTNKKIIKPYVGFTNDIKEFIDIREHIIDKLTKYKIVGLKVGRYGEIKGEYRLPGGSGGSWTDNYYYIMYINIHGEVYGNIFEEKRNKEYYSSGKVWSGWQNSFISNDWFLELFIKPFAIQPTIYTCRDGCNCSFRNISCIRSYSWDNYHWAPYIDKDHYSCKSIMDINNNIVERYYEPKYKDYIESNKIIPKKIMDDILNDKIPLIFSYKIEDLYTEEIREIRYGKVKIKEYIFKLNWDKLYSLCLKNNLYSLFLYNNISDKIIICRGYEERLNMLYKIINKNINITLFECTNSSFTSFEKPFDIIYPDRIHRNVGPNSNFLNIYDIYYIGYLDIQKKKEKIKKLDDNVIININNNILTIENYYKSILNLDDYLPIKTKKILKDGSLIDKKYTDINEIHIKKSNIINININETIKDIHIIKLYECKKFKNISINIRKNLKSLYIDDVLIEIEIEEIEETKAKNRKPRKL
jgi:hypothetical protein